MDIKMLQGRSLTFLSFFLMAHSPLWAAFKNYNMQDLEILEKHKNYREFLQHAHDIRPSKRSTQWSDMVGHMAEGYLTKLLEEKEFNRKGFLFVEKIAEWTPLVNDEFFQAKREKYVRAYLFHCFTAKKKYCSKDLHAFFSRIRKNTELAFQLGVLLKKFNQKASTWLFFKDAVKDNLAEFYCQKEPVQLALVGEIIPILEKHGLKDQNLIRKKIKYLAGVDCWQKLTPLFESWYESKSHKIREYAYILLKLSGALSQEKKDFYLSLYILQGPHKGEVFNEAWNIVRGLGQDFKRRKKLVNSLLTLDPLPDRLFAVKDIKKREVITEFMAKNLPEFFDGYTKTCLSYFSGKKKFPRGNPTIHCQEFVRQSKEKDWVSPRLDRRLREMALLGKKKSK
ncbi:MAG: hypothetical protein OXB84_00755 [Halobacteriovoraceae bacterium]|nr:hypothetical protein [Halobacteriovoraceae bacterium]